MNKFINNKRVLPEKRDFVIQEGLNKYDESSSPTSNWLWDCWRSNIKAWLQSHMCWELMSVSKFGRWRKMKAMEESTLFL